MTEDEKTEEEAEEKKEGFRPKRFFEEDENAFEVTKKGKGEEEKTE